MAFDSVFQGPPEGVNAPGTAQSPSLGVDVVNKELYISSGEGWQELSAGGGGGSIGGSVDSGYVPIAVSANTLGNGPIDYGVTNSSTLTIGNGAEPSGTILITVPMGTSGTIALQNAGTGAIGAGIQLSNAAPGGTSITDNGGGGITIFDNQSGGGPGVVLKGSSGMHLSTSNHDSGVTDGPLQIVSGSDLTLSVDSLSNPAAGITLSSSGSGGITLIPGTGVVTISGLLVPGTIYSAAGTALPDPTLTPGGRAFVSDATANVYGTAYASGGAINAPVYSDGTNWNMG